MSGVKGFEVTKEFRNMVKNAKDIYFFTNTKTNEDRIEFYLPKNVKTTLTIETTVNSSVRHTNACLSIYKDFDTLYNLLKVGDYITFWWDNNGGNTDLLEKNGLICERLYLKIWRKNKNGLIYFNYLAASQISCKDNYVAIEHTKNPVTEAI